MREPYWATAAGRLPRFGPWAVSTRMPETGCTATSRPAPPQSLHRPGRFRHRHHGKPAITPCSGAHFATGGIVASTRPALDINDDAVPGPDGIVASQHGTGGIDIDIDVGSMRHRGLAKLSSGLRYRRNDGYTRAGIRVDECQAERISIRRGKGHMPSKSGAAQGDGAIDIDVIRRNRHPTRPSTRRAKGPPVVVASHSGTGKFDIDLDGLDIDNGRWTRRAAITHSSTAHGVWANHAGERATSDIDATDATRHRHGRQAVLRNQRYANHDYLRRTT